MTKHNTDTNTEQSSKTPAYKSTHTLLLLQLSKAPRANPKKEGRANSPRTKSPAKHKDPTYQHLAQLQTVPQALQNQHQHSNPFFPSAASNSRQKMSSRSSQQGSAEGSAILLTATSTCHLAGHQRAGPEDGRPVPPP
jgi:hypothetical protein